VTVTASTQTQQPELAESPEMVWLAAHELRTPLTIVAGLAQMLERDVQRRMARGAPAAQDWEVEQLGLLSKTLELRRATIRLQAIAEDMLAIRRAAGRWVPVDPLPTDVRLLAVTIGEECRALSSHHQLEVVVEDAPCMVSADPLRLEQVIRNLVNNAVLYSPADTTVTIRVEHAEDFVTLSVRDQGPGIAANQLDAIFLPFYRGSEAADSNNGGSGLGLYLAAKIIEGHEGHIWAESEPPHGSTFFVRLPRYELRQFAIGGT
jgi:signal transduction histidine kinase